MTNRLHLLANCGLVEIILVRAIEVPFEYMRRGRAAGIRPKTTPGLDYDY